MKAAPIGYNITRLNQQSFGMTFSDEAKTSLLDKKYKKALTPETRNILLQLKQRDDDYKIGQIETTSIESKAEDKNYEWVHRAKITNTANGEWILYNFQGNEGGAMCEYNIAGLAKSFQSFMKSMLDVSNIEKLFIEKKEQKEKLLAERQEEITINDFINNL